MLPLSCDIQLEFLQQGMLMSPQEEPWASCEIPLWNNSTHPTHITTHVSSMPQPPVSPAAVGAFGGAFEETRASPCWPCLLGFSTGSRSPFTPLCWELHHLLKHRGTGGR